MQDTTMELPKGVYRRGSRFQVKIKLGPDRVTASFPVLKAATAWAEQCREAYRTGRPLPSPDDALNTEGVKVYTIQDIYDRVWRKRWSLGKSGMEGSSGNARRFIAWAGPKKPAAEALSEDFLLEFLEDRVNRRNSGGTLNHYVNAIKPLAKEAVRMKLIPMMPELPRYPASGTRLRVLEEHEEGPMLAVMRQWGHDDRARLFEFLIDTGCRPGEAQKLRWEDFTPDGRVVLEREITKNSTQRVLGLTERCQETVEHFRGKYGNTYGPFSWASPKSSQTRKLVDRLRAHFGWDESFVVYTFRHTCASRLVRRGTDLYKVQVWMGHKSDAMTQRYAKFAPNDITDLSKVLEGSPAKAEAVTAAVIKQLQALSPEVLQAILAQAAGESTRP